MIKYSICVAILILLFSCNSNSVDNSKQLSAGDKIEIMEVAATFDNSLDKEEIAPFLGTFTDEGTFEISGKRYRGRKELEGVFYYMLNTFAKGKRHCVSNHIINGTADSAVMESYLSVINRNTMERAGSAIQHDEFKRINGVWKINIRKIDIDSSFFTLSK